MKNTFRVEIAPKEKSFLNGDASARAAVERWLGTDPGSVISARFFLIQTELEKSEFEKAAKEVFCDSVVDFFSLNSHLAEKYGDSKKMFSLEKNYLPGVTDNEGKSAEDAFSILLKDKSALRVFSGVQILFLEAEKKSLDPDKIIKRAKSGFYNPVIESAKLISGDDLKNGSVFTDLNAPVVTSITKPTTEKYPVDSPLEHWKRLNSERHLYMNNAEIEEIVRFFSQSEVSQSRQKLDLSEKITDAELECLAQTWSEHCKHKIFAAEITYTDENHPDKSFIVNGLFKEFIQKPTEEISKRKKDFLVSTFVDNSGIIRFDDDHDICFKVETHNSPSALDPYGGALTGIVGVNRDILGTGLGALPIFNTDVFCFAPSDYDEEIPPGLMHPSLIRDGVILGVEHGGNKSGIPTVNGAIVFDQSYLGKPLVFCGTGGILPHRLNGKPTSEKLTLPGDRILMVGGRIGKDGIHGATFSSAELKADSPVSAVQIGDPITQKRMTDFLILARDRGLISGITDNGAGGLSSSVGEMAEITNGAEIDLAMAKTKYQGLKPWELLVSESQERMTVSVNPSHLDEFNKLADFYDVELSDLGEFTESGYFHVKYASETVAYLPLEFLHGGCPQLKLEAVWSGRKNSDNVEELEEEDLEELAELSGDGLRELFLAVLSDENVRTRESVIRRFDHEVKAQTVVKPLTGKESDAPSDAAVIRPLHDSDKSIVVSCGLNPWISRVDPFLMGAFTVDEAFRNAIVVGVNPDLSAILDNFCWPDPIYDSKTNPEGKEKLAWLVRTCAGLREASLAYGLPLISGKDSMKNDYKYPLGHPRAGERISVLPTLLVSLMGVMDSAKKAITSDFKKSGSILYEIGVSPKGLRESVLYRKVIEKNGTAVIGGFNLNVDPEIDLEANFNVYKTFHKKIVQGLVLSAHDVSDGGLAVAIAESCLGGRLGAAVTAISNDPMTSLFSEAPGRILVEVASEHREKFEEEFHPAHIRFIGRTNEDEFEIETSDGGFHLSLKDLEKTWKGGVFKWR